MVRGDQEELFCGWAVSLRWEDIPEQAVTAALDLLVDFAGCAIGGLATETSIRCRSIAAPAAEGSHILGLPGLWPSPEAARQTAIAGHALEMDDVVPSASSHPATVIIPAALAIGETVGSTGRDLIRAIAVGYELMIRLGEAVDPARHYADGFHPTATCGVFGAAAAGAILLGADSEELRTALGFAGTGAAGTLSYLNDGAPTKPVQVGNSAAYGTTAALLNHAGVVGPATVFEGRYGFYQAYAPHSDPGRLTKGLGSEALRLLSTSVKPFACCRYVQPGAGLLLEAVDEGLVADNVESVRIGVVTPALEIVGLPRERKVAPQSVPDAQFSLPFCAAVALTRGRLLPYDLAQSLGDPAVEVLADRVELVADPQLDRAYPDRWGAWIDVALRDGGRVERSAGAAKGDPDNPLIREELLEKVTALAGPERARAVDRGVATILDTSVSEFVSLLSEEG